MSRCWRQAEAIGRRWGVNLRQRRPGDAWPAWDDVGAASERVRELARAKVAELAGRSPRVADDQVRDRLARVIGVVVGRVYAGG